MAPEVMRGERYGKRADIYSLGCTITHILTGKLPYSDVLNLDFIEFFLLRNVDYMPLPSEDSGIDSEWIQLLKLMLNRNRKERITSKDLLKHPFLVIYN